MPPPKKEFVKYTFDDQPTKSRQAPVKEKPQSYAKAKRHVSYTQKPNVKQNVLKDMIDSYIPMKKPSKEVMAVCNSFPKYFSAISKKPQPLTSDLLNAHLIILNKKPFEPRNNPATQHEKESSQDPDWDSESDYEGGIQSKRIDQDIIQKISQKLSSIKPINNSQLKNHEKRFLEDYYRQKRLQQEAKQVEQALKPAPQEESTIKNVVNNGNEFKQKQQDFDDWTEYEEKKVNDFIDMGFIEKIQPNDEDAQYPDFEDQDFSVQDEKSEKSNPKSEQSSQEDDIFGDQGPCTIVQKTKQTTTERTQNSSSKPDSQGLSPEPGSFNQGTLIITSQVFSRIAQQVGIPSSACHWIISNKNQQYKVTTQYMDELYRQNGLSNLLPYISLNHSQFVHNSQVESQAGLRILKNYQARRHNSNGSTSNGKYKKYNQQQQQGYNNRYPQQRKQMHYKVKQMAPAKTTVPVTSAPSTTAASKRYQPHPTKNNVNSGGGSSSKKPVASSNSTSPHLNNI